MKAKILLELCGSGTEKLKISADGRNVCGSKITEQTNVKKCLIMESNVCKKMLLSSARFNVRKEPLRYKYINDLSVFACTSIFTRMQFSKI
jgi:hypothetical protein